MSDIDGAEVSSVDIGGVGSITGQNSLVSSSSSSNVEGGTSTADSYLDSADGLETTSIIDIASDGGLTGLNIINLAAAAESTSGSSANAFTTSKSLDGAEFNGHNNWRGWNSRRSG